MDSDPNPFQELLNKIATTRTQQINAIQSKHPFAGSAPLAKKATDDIAAIYYSEGSTISKLPAINARFQQFFSDFNEASSNQYVDELDDLMRQIGSLQMGGGRRRHRY
jgi:hypothetical protein